MRDRGALGTATICRAVSSSNGKVPVTPIHLPVVIPHALQRVNCALARVVGNEVVAETIETQAASLGPCGITRSVTSKMANRVVPSSLTDQVSRERYCQPILPEDDTCCLECGGWEILRRGPSRSD